MTQRYTVHNLHCSGCAAKIEEALAALPGVRASSIDLGSACLRLEGEQPALDVLNRIADAIEPGTHFSHVVDAIVTGVPQPEEQESLLLSAWPLWLALALFAMGLLGEAHLEAMLSPLGAQLLCFGVPFLLCGLPVLRQAGRTIQRGDFFNEYTLMSFATLAAFAINEWPEAVSVMLFYRLGEMMQERAAGRSRHSIKALLAARPTVAHRLTDTGDTEDIAPEAVLPDMVLVVRAGEKLPVDGIVTRGTSSIDTSPLTGEAVPVSASAGKKVFAGTINLESTLTIKVTARYADSSVARILELVEQAVGRKAPIERFITRFARYYTPAVALGAFLVAVIPPLLGLGDFREWLYRALVLLVISCPCALLISVPLGYLGGIGAASRKGILIKGGYVLDALRSITTVAMDKTGTLTQGIFEVTDILPADGIDPTETLAVAALVEQHSNHPLARSILRAAKQRDLSLASLKDVRTVAGKGLISHEGLQTLAVGNAALMESEGIALPEQAFPQGTLVHVARNGRYLGTLVVADALRPESASAIRALREQGLERVVMLTGDRTSSAESVAKDVGIQDVRAELLPEDKASVLESLGATKHTLFVGDGINDAPALTLSGVGVAMGGLGSEAAIEVADAVILDDSPARLPELFRIAARTRLIVWQNIALAFGVKAVFMGLGIVGLSGLWEAVFADVGVALLAVLNASRVMQR